MGFRGNRSKRQDDVRPLSSSAHAGPSEEGHSLAFVRIVVDINLASIAAGRAAVDIQPLVGCRDEVPCASVRETQSEMLPMTFKNENGTRGPQATACLARNPCRN